VIWAIYAFAFRSPESYADNADFVPDRVKKIEPAPGVDEVLIPGETAARSTEWRRARSGMELATATTSACGTRRIASMCAAPMNPIPTTLTLSRCTVNGLSPRVPSRHLSPVVGRCRLFAVAEPPRHLIGAALAYRLKPDALVARIGIAVIGLSFPDF